MKQKEPTLLKVEQVDEDWVIRWSTNDKWRSDITGHPLSVTYEVYRIVGVEQAPNAGALLFEGGEGEMDHKYDIDEAEPDFYGFIKWDGCGHLMVPDSENGVYYHMCGSEDAKRIAALFPKLWETAAELMPGYDLS